MLHNPKMNAKYKSNEQYATTYGFVYEVMPIKSAEEKGLLPVRSFEMTDDDAILYSHTRKDWSAFGPIGNMLEVMKMLCEPRYL